MEAINGSAGAARNSHQLEGGPSSDRHVKKLFVTFIDQEGAGEEEEEEEEAHSVVCSKGAG